MDYESLKDLRILNDWHYFVYWINDLNSIDDDAFHYTVHTYIRFAARSEKLLN